MAAAAVNPLLSTQKSSDGLQVALHPLPVLEISDYITRSFQRGYKGALVGALLGESKGREITVEHSFTCGVTPGKDGSWNIDAAQFATRLEQLRLVHKTPQLELVGWYTLISKYGPTQEHLTIHNQILETNETAVLLGFHLEQVLNPATGNLLPLTIYESIQESEDASRDAPTDGGDREMKDADATPQMVTRFRELPYTTETGEAEMIAMQFIREGVSTARADNSQQKPTDRKGKGKAKAKEEEDKQPVSEDANLTKEELEQIAALQTKANALKMMKDRIALLVAYLQHLPDEYRAPGTNVDGTPLPVSNSILRQIQALVTNVELVTPAQQESLQKELLSETNDVKLIGLVTDMLSSLKEIRTVGRTFAVVESAKNQRSWQNDSQPHSYGDLRGPPGAGLSGVGDLML